MTKTDRETKRIRKRQKEGEEEKVKKTYGERVIKSEIARDSRRNMILHIF